MREYYIEQENDALQQTHIEYFLQDFPSKDVRVDPHIHTAVEILHIKAGEFLVIVDDAEYYLKKGETILIRSNNIHLVYPLSEEYNAYYVMKFMPDYVLNLAADAQRASYLLNFALLNSKAKVVWNKEESAYIAEIAERLFKESKEQQYGSDIAIGICFTQIMLAILRDINISNQQNDFGSENLARRIYDALIYINQHYAEDITAMDCSNHVFLSYSYFSRHFKRITGRTFSDYLTLTRINHAEKALISTQKPISQIADECGFNNFPYFSAIYKKIKGVSPSAVRDQAVPNSGDKF